MYVECVLCDEVRQENNGKHLLIGVYSRDIVFPDANWSDQGGSLKSFCVFLQLFDLQKGKHKLRLELHGPNGALADGFPSGGGEVDFVEDYGHLKADVAPMIFPQKGEYVLNLYVDDELALARTFGVITSSDLPEHIRPPV